MSINAAKIFNRYRNAEKLAGNGIPNICAERGEGNQERFDRDKNEEEIQRDRSGKAIA